MKVFNSKIVKKEYIDKMIKKDIPLLWNINLSYTDLKGYERYEYDFRYKIKVIKKEPLVLQFEPVS